MTQQGNNNGTVVAETKVIVKLTAFKPRREARYGDRIVDETEFLGSFRSKKGNLWLRLTASQSTPNPRSPTGFDSQWGRILMFGQLVPALVNAIVDGGKNYLTISAHCKQQVVINRGSDGRDHVNIVWVTYGFELNGKFYTTKKGKLHVSDSNRYQSTEDMESDLQRMLVDEGGIEEVGGFTNRYTSSNSRYSQPQHNRSAARR